MQDWAWSIQHDSLGISVFKKQGQNKPQNSVTMASWDRAMGPGSIEQEGVQHWKGPVRQ